jgi:hypothetical protein
MGKIVQPQWLRERNLKMLATPGQRFKHYVNLSGIAGNNNFIWGADSEAATDTYFDFDVRVVTSPRWLLPPNWIGPTSDSVCDVSPSAWFTNWHGRENDDNQFLITGIDHDLVDQGNGGLQIRLTISFRISGGFGCYVQSLGYFVGVTGTLAPVDDAAEKI